MSAASAVLAAVLAVVFLTVGTAKVSALAPMRVLAAPAMVIGLLAAAYRIAGIGG